MEKKIRLGIVGAGRIVARVMTDLHNAHQIELTAIAGMNREEAENAARKYGARLAFPSFEAMAESDEIDLAYIAIPNPFHEKYACLMMDHGKAVLCEKPAGLNEQQVMNMTACARKNGVFWMEAMWTRFMPAVQKMMQVIEEGQIGDVSQITAHFSYCPRQHDENDRVYNLALGGGALLDLGVYPLMLCTRILAWEPKAVQGYCKMTQGGVDLRTSAQLIYGNGAVAHFFCGMDAVSTNDLFVYGTKGLIRMPESWHATSFILERKGEEPERFTFPPENEGHHYEFDHVADCLHQGLKASPEISWEESVAVSRICRQIRHENGLYYNGEKR